jgi:uncharacterized protein (DUF2384 family)
MENDRLSIYLNARLRAMTFGSDDGLDDGLDDETVRPQPQPTQQEQQPNYREGQLEAAVMRVRELSEQVAAQAALGGGARLAEVLGVSRSQPTRWRKGEESPSPATAREMIDLDHVMARALMLFTQPVAIDWLTSANSYLDDARPIDVLRTRGSTEVIDALDALMTGAFS